MVQSFYSKGSYSNKTRNTRINYQYIKSLLLENGRYGHAPIRSDTSIRVYVTADTDTSTPRASVPVTYIIIPGRSGECSYFTQWVAHSIQG